MKLIVKSLIVWQLVFKEQRFLLIDILVFVGVGFSGYFWLAFGFDDCYSLLVMAVTLFLIVFRWLLVLSVPIRTAPLPYKNPKKLAEFVEPKFAALLNRIKEIDLKVDWFLAMDIWQTKDYADVKQLQVQEIKQQWVDILVHLAELDGLRKRFSRFGEIDYLKAPDLFTKAFLIADTALVSLIYNSLRIINATYHHEFMEEILDNEDQSVNLLTGNYTRLVENAVHVNEFVRVYLGVVFLKYIKRKKYIKISEENYEVIFGYLRDINLLFSEYGLGNLFQFLRRMFKKETYRLWFPLQKNVAEAMGAIRLPIRDYNLIATEQIQLMQEQLLPGDIVLVRSSWYLSNVGLPGFWPHAILYLGDVDQFLAYFEDDIDVQEFLQAKYREAGLESVLEGKFAAAWRKWQKHDDWGNPCRVVEAVSAGVVIKSLEVVGSVDYVAAIRPQLTKVQKLQAILYALANFGKPYDFEFDFRIDSASVCTELIYKAYSRVADLPIKPIKLAGKVTLPANEFIKSFAKDTDFWEFVYFIDGDPKLGTAKIKNAKQLSKSWKRSKWDFVNEGLFD